MPAVLGLLLFTGCKPTPGNLYLPETTNLAVAVNTQSPDTLAGLWQYNSTIWYTANLTLKENGMFTFHDHGCLGQNFTEGLWEKKNGAILLSSYDKYKQDEKPIFVVTIPNEHNQDSVSKKGPDGSAIVHISEMTLSFVRLHGDTTLIYFHKVQLSLTDGTLYCIDSNKYISQYKFVKANTAN